MLTAFGELSCNRTCGIRLAEGEPLAEILNGPNKLTVEGVPTAAVAVEFAAKSNLIFPSSTPSTPFFKVSSPVTKPWFATWLAPSPWNTPSTEILPETNNVLFLHEMR